MATLSAYFGPHRGNMQIYVGLFQIGSGAFKAFDDSHAAFSGSYNVFGKAGAFSLDIKLTDGKPQSKSGACEIKLNNKTDKAATYKVNGKKLTFATKLNNTPVNLYTSQGGTQLDGVSDHNLWIGP